MLTPTVQPWYLVWIVPFLCLYPNPAWILLSGLVAVSYHVVIGFVLTESWEEETWVRFVQYVPFYGLLFVQSLRDGTWHNVFRRASETFQANLAGRRMQAQSRRIGLRRLLNSIDADASPRYTAPPCACHRAGTRLSVCRPLCHGGCHAGYIPVFSGR